MPTSSPTRCCMRRAARWRARPSPRVLTRSWDSRFPPRPGTASPPSCSTIPQSRRFCRRWWAITPRPTMLRSPTATASRWSTPIPARSTSSCRCARPMPPCATAASLRSSARCSARRASIRSLCRCSGKARPSARYASDSPRSSSSASWCRSSIAPCWSPARPC